MRAIAYVALDGELLVVLSLYKLSSVIASHRLPAFLALVSSGGHDDGYVGSRSTDRFDVKLIANT